MCYFKSLLFILSISFLSIQAQEKEAAKWDVSNPEGNWNFKELKLSTDEGTWMNLDVSPDGSKIAFDLLGDIYIMPIEGGNATLLREGLPFEIQPRFSPDGSKLSFTSDASGGDNIWVMDINGSNAKQITEEKFRLLNNAIWTPDNNYLVARKHFTSERSAGAGELWMYHITGGVGLQITTKKNDQQDVNEPSISTDGNYLYYSEDVYPGDMFLYNKDPNNQIYVINRYNMETSEIDQITGGPGGAARPQVSRDGKKLAFVKRVRTKSVLYIHDLETNEEWPIFDNLDKDQQEAWAIFGVYPNFSWMPNNEELVFWAKGKINRININTLEVKNIPFKAESTIKIAEALEFDIPVSNEDFNAKMIRNAVTSPDEKSLVFSALGKLHIKSLPNGKPRRLTSSTDLEFEPSFSPNGKELVYVSWNDENLGQINKVPANGGSPIKLNKNKGIYRTPTYSNDGNHIVYKKESGNSDQGFSFTKNSGIYTMNASGDNHEFIIKEGEYPVFNSEGDRIVYQTGGQLFGSLTKELKSVDLNGKDEKILVSSKYANRMVLSPDNNWIAFTNLQKAYVAPLPKSGHTIDLKKEAKNFVPISQISKDAGINLHWSKNSDNIHWTLGDEYFTNILSERFTFLENSPDSIPPMTERGLKIDLTYKADKPSGIIAFTGATIITMEGDKVIENGTIIIRENKIESIGNTSEINISPSAKVYDVTGKTIMPGIVDVHAHVGGYRYGLTNQKHWQFYANLAYGVTTSHDPATNTESIFTFSELIKSGEIVGPRLYSTGTILYGADGDFKAVVNNLDDARSAIKRTKAFGAFSVKSYNQPRRDQRQQVIQAAREEGVFVVPEGGSTFYHNMTMIMDGHTGIEHNIPVAQVYKDVKSLWGSSNTGYTPTLIVSYGSINGQFYFYEHDNVWENEKLLKYTPRAIIDSRSRHRLKIPQEEYDNGYILNSKTCKELTDAGVKVNLGAHGELQGLGAHWELWMFAQGGMTNMEALQAATINGANYIGAGKDIGSLKVGKLADLIVMDKNPLEDIRNTDSIIYTMVNGRLFDTETMNEIGNEPKTRTKFYWENNKYNAAFPWHEETKSFSLGKCSCNLGSH
jgi:imidazolonepropionase-like amidohydrolase/Tol biopolymer transport system component